MQIIKSVINTIVGHYQVKSHSHLGYFYFYHKMQYLQFIYLILLNFSYNLSQSKYNK